MQRIIIGLEDFRIITTTDLISALVSVSSPVKAVVWRRRGEGVAPKLPAPSLTPLVAGSSTRQKVIAF